MLTRNKKIIKTVIILLILYLIYMILGATLPFIRQKEVSDSAKEKLEVSRFYEDSVSVDRAAVVEDSNDALDIRLRMLNDAKEKIIMSSFSFKTDRCCREIFSTVLAAAERGVEVEIIADGLSAGIDMKRDPMYYVLAAHDNVTIKYYNMFNLLKPWTFNGRLHDKFVIIDDRMLILGGRNTSNYFLGTYNTKVLSYDRDIFVYNTAAGTKNSEESVIKEVEEYFYTLWNCKDSEIVFDKVPRSRKSKIASAKKMLEETYQNLLVDRADIMTDDFDYMAYTVPTNKITLITNPIHIMSKEPYIWYQINELMQNAKERVFIQTPYAVLNKAMENDLKKLKGKLKQYDMLLNSIEVGDNYMASSDYLFNKQDVIDTGVTVYEFAGEHSMHNKSILIDDDISIIGSYNFDMRSVYLDTETMLVVHGKEFNKELENAMNAMKEQSYEVDSNGEYVAGEDVSLPELPWWKKLSFRVTSVIFQIIRYLL
ncbi:phospholipase D-like domain-containing protein [Anaerosporobacter sp.]